VLRGHMASRFQGQNRKPISSTLKMEAPQIKFVSLSFKNTCKERSQSSQDRIFKPAYIRVLPLLILLYSVQNPQLGKAGACLPLYRRPKLHSVEIQTM
jgi:hypothetical protein